MPCHAMPAEASPTLRPPLQQQQQQQQAQPPQQAGLVLCSQNRLDKKGLACRACYDEVPQRAVHAFYGWPGGAACCKERRIALCPRAWQ